MMTVRRLAWRALVGGCALLAGSGVFLIACSASKAPPAGTRAVMASAIPAASATPAPVLTSVATAPATWTRPPSPAATLPPTLAATGEPTAIQPSPPAQMLVSGATARPPAATLRPAVTPQINQPVRQLAELKTGADDLAFSPDGKRLAVGSASYEAGSQFAVEVWDVASGRLQWRGMQADAVRKIAFSSDGTRVGSVSFDKTARLWDAASGAVVAQLEYGYWVYGLDFSPEGNRWATGGFDGKVIVADASSGQVRGEFRHDLMVLDLALAPNGPWLAVLSTGSYGPGRVTVWDVQTHEQRVLADFDGVAYGNVTFSPDTRWLAAPLGSGGQIAIWQTQIWPEVTRLSTPPGTVSRLIFSPNGQRMAALIQGGETQNQIVVWDVPTWRTLSQFTLVDVGWDIAFSPNGRWLVAGLGQGIEHPAALEAQLWDASSGKLLAHLSHAEQVLAVAFSGDGRRIATGSHGAVKIWELRTGE